MATPTNKNLLALDVGDRRIGVAVASTITKLPRPLITIFNDENSFDEIQNLINAEQIDAVIIGLPRGLSGQETKQTKTVLSFGQALATKISLPFFWQDEALTSQKAESELRNRRVSYNKEHVDALAATYILEDWLSEHSEDLLK